MPVPILALTAGEPAGIGPELLVKLAGSGFPGRLVAICDPDLLTATANMLRLPLSLVEHDPDARRPRQPGELAIVPFALPRPARPGRLDPGNAPWVLDTLARAADGAAAGEFAAVVTAPVHKAVINAAGIAFTGHTEFFADRAGCKVVMLLQAGDAPGRGGALRVALATTHLPLAQVPVAITRERLTGILRTLHEGLVQRFGITQPRIAVLGLNPHAGEEGVLGREEIETIGPVIGHLRAEGMDLVGPLPADTAFVPRHLQGFDAVLAMYHDQGLPVLKHAGFGHAVNVTLGLPWVRTSVDHGTALDLAGSGRADVGSLLAAARLALELGSRHRADS